MKILFFTSTDDRLGGAKSLIELVRLLKENGIEITVINPFNNQLNAELFSLGIENYSAGYQLDICRRDCKGIKLVAKALYKYCYYQFAKRSAYKYIEKSIDLNTYDVIHSNNSVEDIGVYFAKKYSIPHVWHLREFGKEDFDFMYFHRNIGKYISDNSTCMIAISDAVKRSWIEKGASQEKIETIIHGIDTSIIKVAKHQNRKIRMVFAGSILPEKGQYDFIKALASLPDNARNNFLLDLYGPCQELYLKEIVNFLKQHNMEHTVSFKGYSSKLNVLLQEYDVGIVNSRCEAMGRVTIEYMVAGLCILASNRGANPELLGNGEFGLLYEYGNHKSIADKLKQLEKFPELIEEKGLAACFRARELYSISQNVGKYIKLYERVMR